MVSSEASQDGGLLLRETMGHQLMSGLLTTGPPGKLLRKFPMSFRSREAKCLTSKLDFQNGSDFFKKSLISEDLTWICYDMFNLP